MRPKAGHYGIGADLSDRAMAHGLQQPAEIRDDPGQVCGDPCGAASIVCVNGLIAVGAMLNLESLDVKGPEAVAVTGFDNTLIGMVSRTALTNVAQPIDEIARRAVSIANSEEEELPSQCLFHGEL